MTAMARKGEELVDPAPVSAAQLLSFDEFLSPLAMCDSVAGVVLIGSIAAEAIGDSSDYDLLVVFDDLPAPLRIVTTWVDQSFTEIYCTTTDAIARIASTEAPIPSSSEEGTLVSWLRSGKIELDRTGILESAQKAARTNVQLAFASGADLYEAWRTIGYNVAQAKRYLLMDDPVSRTALEMRLLYSLSEAMTGYFAVRRIAWDGEKAAVRYWTDHDPTFLDLFRTCLAETDPGRRVSSYEALARLAVAPVGELWTVGTTVIGLGSGFGTGQSQAPTTADPSAALAAWSALIAGGE